MNTAIYIRVSTDSQAEKGYSVEAQRDHLINYCQLHNIESPTEYLDAGYSGGSLDRPGLQRLITDIAIGKIERVIVYKLDRLSRRTKDTLYLVEDIFNKHNVKFVSLTDNIDTSTSSGKFFLSILSSVAQLERENIKERSNLGKEKKAQKGLPSRLGTMPIGYDWDQNNACYIINSDAEHVKQIFQMFTAGKTLYRINEIMKQFSHKYGRYGDQKVIWNMLRNPVYTGKLKRNGLIYASPAIPPIITEEQFDKAAALIAKSREESKSYSSASTKHLLTNFLWCGICGARCAAHKHRHNDNYYYMCYSRYGCVAHMITDRGCSSSSISVVNLDKYIEERVLKLSHDFNNGAEQIKTDEIKIKKYITDKQSEADKNNEMLDMLLDLYLNKKTDKETYVRKSAELKQTKAKIALEINDAKKMLHRETRIPDNYLKSITELWTKGDLKSRRDILHKLIKRIIINNNKIEIQWNFNIATI